MEEVMVYMGIIAVVVYYMYLFFGYGNSREKLLKLGLCKHHRYNDPRFVRFILVFTAIPAFLWVIGYVATVIATIGFLLSPLIVIYLIVMYFVDKYMKNC